MSDATPTQAVTDSFEAYAADRGDARFTEWLRARAEPDFSAAVDHRFAEELAAGTIDDAVFRRYLMQDYAFLDALVGTFGHAVGDAPDMAARSRLVEFLAVLTDDENDYFERSFAALDVPESAYADPEPTATTRAFEDLLGRAAREGGYAEALAVLVPAEWVYLSWADPRADADALSVAVLLSNVTEVPRVDALQQQAVDAQESTERQAAQRDEAIDDLLTDDEGELDPL